MTTVDKFAADITDDDRMDIARYGCVIDIIHALNSKYMRLVIQSSADQMIATGMGETRQIVIRSYGKIMVSRLYTFQSVEMKVRFVQENPELKRKTDFIINL